VVIVEWLAVAVAAVFLVAVLIFIGRRAATAGPSRQRGSWEETDTSGSIVLDLEVTDPDDPTVQRLVQDAGRRALVTHPELDHVEVHDRGGQLLATVTRSQPLGGDVTIPDQLHTGATHPRRHTPNPVAPAGATREPTHAPDPGGDVHVPDRSFADRFVLPEHVRSTVRDPDRATDVVAAILVAAGRPVERQGDVVVSGDTAIAIVPNLARGMEDAITRAFMHLRDSTADRGIIVRLGYVDPAEIRRREAAAPDVKHVTADAIQRMADAVALGGDPIAFAIGPAVRR
jgi:hypothetical protein